MGDPGPQPNTRFLGHIQVHILKGILISSAILAQLMVVTKKRDRQTDRQTRTHARTHTHARARARTHAHAHAHAHTHTQCYICSNRPHLMLCVAMWLNYTPERCGTMLETIILKNVQLVQQNFRPPPVLWVRNTGGAFNFCTIEPFVPSVLWHCLLGDRKGIRPVKKTEWWGACVVICLERCADWHMAQLMPLPPTVSCFSKIQIGFTFLVPAHLGSPGQRAVKRVCVWEPFKETMPWLSNKIG